MTILNSLYERIQTKQKTLLIFDYDGTLSPIAETPDKAVLNTMVKNALENMAKWDFLSVAIVTGRKIDDLKAVSKLNTGNMALYGLHGGEVELKNKYIGGVFDYKDFEILQNFYNSLKKKTNDLQGILIEDKKFSVVLHYRNADEQTGERATRIFNEELLNHKANENFKIQTGKKVIELLPIDFSKGKAVNDIILSNKEYAPFYFGDDITDISAFEEVRKYGGYAVGMLPNPFLSADILDFEIAQGELEDFLININGAYGHWKAVK